MPSGSSLGFADELPPLELRRGELAVAMAPHGKGEGEGVDRLGSDAVKPNAELENLVVVFGAGIDAGDTFHDLPEGDSASEIPDRDPVSLHGDRHPVAIAHDELIHGIVHDLFNQDVNTVVVMGAVAHAPDVHARPLADMLQGGERLDLALVVVMFLGGTHESKGGHCTDPFGKTQKNLVPSVFPMADLRLASPPHPILHYQFVIPLIFTNAYAILFHVPFFPARLSHLFILHLHNSQGRSLEI